MLEEKRTNHLLSFSLDNVPRSVQKFSLLPFPLLPFFSFFLPFPFLSFFLLLPRSRGIAKYSSSVGPGLTAAEEYQREGTSGGALFRANLLGKSAGLLLLPLFRIASRPGIIFKVHAENLARGREGGMHENRIENARLSERTPGLYKGVNPAGSNATVFEANL